MTVGATAHVNTHEPGWRQRPPLALASPQAIAETAPVGALDRPLAEVDPEIAEALERELNRQRHSLEMIASENFVSAAML